MFSFTRYLIACLAVFWLFLPRICLAADISFDGIALGEEATKLIKKFKIDPSDSDGFSSDEGCDRIAAKRLISCVWHVAKCRENGNVEWCPPTDKCASEYERSVRAQEDQQCREEEAQASKASKWAANVKYAIKPNQVVCSNPKTYREVINAYLDGNEGPLRRELGFGCSIFESITLAKILGKSKDGKLCHVQYIIPYSNDLSDGWLSKNGLISKRDYQRSRY